jgi:predicted DNA-binding WGR domain protein
MGSCEQTNSEMKNYFDEGGEIFLKLYKKEGNTYSYWETWNTNIKSAAVHWGNLGETGDKKTVYDIFSKSAFQKKLNKLIYQKINDGYREIPLSEQYTVLVTFKLDNWGSPDDLRRREELRSILTEHLGWTGNGKCDDADIGSGEMTLYCDVIDPYLASKTITQEFELKGITNNYKLTILKGEELLEDDYNPK